MKKTIQYIGMAALCLFLSSVADAQTQALKVGDRVPDVTINNILNYKSQSAKLSDFKGKLLVLDFWASWCSPCIAMIPKMDSLQKQFEGSVQFLPVTYQTAREVEAFRARLKKKGTGKSALPEVVQDKTLHDLFPHTVLPHYVWIDGGGIVQAITGFEVVNETNINKFLRGSATILATKKDTSISYDREKLLLVGNNGGDGSKLLFHSLLSSYTPGLSGGYSIRAGSEYTGKRITARNQSLSSLYRLAFGASGFYAGKNRLLLEVKDPLPLESMLAGTAYRQWMEQGNAFCYEIQVPPTMSALANTMMQADLDRLFPRYEANIEKRVRDCLVLIRTSDETKIASSGGLVQGRFDPFGFTLKNNFLGVLIDQLNVMYLQKSPLPVIDGTGLTARIDLAITAPMGNIVAMNQELEKYHLKFVEQEREIDMIILRDRIQNDK